MEHEDETFDLSDRQELRRVGVDGDGEVISLAIGADVAAHRLACLLLEIGQTLVVCEERPPRPSPAVAAREREQVSSG